MLDIAFAKANIFLEVVTKGMQMLKEGARLNLVGLRDGKLLILGIKVRANGQLRVPGEGVQG